MMDRISGGMAGALIGLAMAALTDGLLPFQIVLFGVASFGASQIFMELLE